MPINGAELLVLLVLAVVLVGPERLPEYARKAAALVVALRRLAEESTERLRDELDLDDVDLSTLDPRQYDPRRIIREAWGDTDIEELLPSKEALSVAAGGAAAGAAATSKSGSGTSRSAKDEGPQRAPFDDEAT